MDPFVGGKGIDNRGGKVPDFVLRNPLTQHALIVEIKTPKTKLLGSEYRAGVFGMSDDLSGALVQSSRYRMTLMHEFKQLHYDTSEPDKFFAFDPPAVIIAGSLSEFVGDRDRTTCLELFRNGWKSVHLLSYDELFERVQLLVEQLESNEDAMQHLGA